MSKRGRLEVEWVIVGVLVFIRSRIGLVRLLFCMLGLCGLCIGLSIICGLPMDRFWLIPRNKTPPNFKDFPSI